MPPYIAAKPEGRREHFAAHKTDRPYSDRNKRLARRNSATKSTVVETRDDRYAAPFVAWPVEGGDP